MILTATNVKSDPMAEMISKHEEMAQNAVDQLDKLRANSTNRCDDLETKIILLHNQPNSKTEESANEYCLNKLKQKLEEEVSDN